MTGMLKRVYFSLIVPVVAGFICIYFLKRHEVNLPGNFWHTKVFCVAVLVISAVFSVAGPVLLITLFAYSMKGESYTPIDKFIRFEKYLVGLAMVAPYCGVTAYLFDFPHFYMSGTFLISLYAVYYFYPSNRRIKFEKGIFRVR